jgi:hypothetical protein
MRVPTPSVPLVLAGALAGLIFVSPALSSKGAVQQMDAPVVLPMASSKTRPSRPAPRIAQTGLDCVKTRRSLWVEGEGWIVRRVSVCR